ncbi:MAG TPA: histidine triad nucleotide-binding protein [Gemmatimonadaceae bacterium]|nr:histidine triad nucleotide-binding protein [Gemmatimonadaceae bacterium]
MTDTIFGRIARREVSVPIVAESERCLAIRDIAPQAPVHILVIPKDSYASLNDVDDPAVLGDLLSLARDVARQQGLADDGYRIVINTNRDGGQSVFHLHAHVLGGRPLGWPPG